MLRSLVGSEMCIRDRLWRVHPYSGEGCSQGKWPECVHYESSTLHACISEFLSDSKIFMHDQSECQCDPFQDRPAEKGGQGWVEFIVCAPSRLRETFFTAHWWCQQSSFVPSRVGVRRQPSCTVRTVVPQKGLETRRKYTRIQLYP